MTREDQLKDLTQEIDDKAGQATKKPSEMGFKSVLGIGDVETELLKTRETIRRYIGDLSSKLDGLTGVVDALKQIKVSIGNEIRVSNLRDIPKTVLNFPDFIQVKKPLWLDVLIRPLTDIAGIIEKISSKELPKDAKDAIPVRLSDGDKFYNALNALFPSGGGTGGGSMLYEKANGEVSRARVSDSQHVVVDVSSMPAITISAEDIEIGAVEIKNSTDDTRATVGANGLNVDVQASSGIGSLTETAPATDTASSGLNGRLQRIAQRLTSLIALLPTALGQGTMATSLKVVLPSDQSSIPVAATLNAETTKVIGTVRMVGNIGAVIDGVNTAATAPANGILGLGIYNSTEPSPTTGQSVGVQLDAKGRQRQVIMDAAGNTRGANVDANSNLGVVLAAETTKIIGTVRIDQTTPGTTDSVSLATAQGAGATIGTTAGAAVITDANGTLQQYLRGIVKLLITSGTIVLGAGSAAIGKLAANSGVTIGAVEIAAAQTLATLTTLTTLTGSGVAHDGVDSGNPHKIGAKAITLLSTATLVSSGDRTDAQSDLDGAIIVRNQVPLGDLISERVSNTDGASTAFSNFTAVSGVKNYITQITVFNSSATAGYLDLRTGTGGAILYTIPLPAGGGAVVGDGNSPLFKTAANNALAYDVSAALSTVYISVSGFQSKVA